MSIQISTSTLFLPLAARFPHLSVDYADVLSGIAFAHPELGDALRQHAKDKAAYIIPQLLLELGYSTVTGTDMDRYSRRACIPFSLVCLSLGIADDILDSDPIAFDCKMVLGCTSMVTSNYAYSLIARDQNPQRREAMLDELEAMMKSVVRGGLAEIDYRRFVEFSLDRYLGLTAMKTTCYTRHSLALAARLAGATSAQCLQLARLGDHLGKFIQLLDDVLDIARDSHDGSAARTYPMELRSKGDSMTAVADLLRDELRATRAICVELACPAMFLEVLNALSEVVGYCVD